MKKVKQKLSHLSYMLLDNMPEAPRRRLMQQYFRITRSITLGVRAVVFDGQGRVLLVRHTYKPGWQFPGGGVEKGETALQALAHELHDEAAIRLLNDRPQLFGIYANHAVFPNDHVLLYLLYPDDYKRHPWQPNHEIAELGFFSRDALPEETTPGTRQRLREILDGLPPADAW